MQFFFCRIFNYLHKEVSYKIESKFDIKLRFTILGRGGGGPPFVRILHFSIISN